jgi:hypothetical protein
MPIPQPFRPPRQEDLHEEIKEQTKPVLIYFLEPKSNLCQLIEPSVQEICSKYKDLFHFVSARMSTYRDYFYEWHIHSCPAFLLFKDGEEIRRMVNIRFTNGFKTQLENFLVGDFLFDRSHFEYVDSVTFYNVINTGLYYHLMVFMEPGNPMNWKLKPILADLRDHYSSQLEVALVNTKKTSDLIEDYNIKQLPAALLFKEGVLANHWVPAYNPKRLHTECVEAIS